MDFKASAEAPLPSTPHSMPSRRRWSYIVLHVLIVLALATYIFYPEATDREPQPRNRGPQLYSCDPGQPTKRVAIIGAGSAGASAAYYLSKYTQRCQRVNITIYERSAYIGGRSTTVNAFDEPSEPVELGASIFVKVNRNLVDAVEAFGLSTRGLKSEDEGYAHDLGIYNGQDWLYVQNNDDAYWWNAAKLLWKYGTSPIRTRNLMRSTTGKFFKMYDAPHFPFRDLSQVVHDVGLTDVTAVTGEVYLKQNGIGEAFARDLIQASTRVNYAQNLDTIHGLETMVCMATDGAMSVEGGNWRIFANMVIASGARVKLETSVDSVSMQKDGTYKITTSSPVTPDEVITADPAIYDDIILAAPLQYANLTLNPKPLQPPSEIPYVNLHVTLFTSPHRLNPLAFKLSATDHVPATILTTVPRKGIHATLPFYSISTLRSLLNPSTGEREFLYKIFSSAPIEPGWLQHILAPVEGAAKRINRHDRNYTTWIYEKIWHSYPVESPRVTFEELVIDLQMDGMPVDEGKDPIQMGRLWYTSGIEGFISTMETSSLMGQNVARLIVDGWMGRGEWPAYGEKQAKKAGKAQVTGEL